MDGKTPTPSASPPSTPAPRKSDADLATLRHLSQSYQPPPQEIPLISPLLPTTHLTTEYAAADPTYATKTAALPSQFSHYRTVRGDGNCGYRALAFSYFEALAKHGKGPLLIAEVERMQALSAGFEAVGWSNFTTEDFVDETLLLLRSLVSAADPSSDKTAAFLLQSMGEDEERSNAVVTHFRLLTSAHIRLNPDEYAPFIATDTAGGDAADYCAGTVEPFTQEIEHVGMKALLDAVLLPVGIRVEVIYLDRSEGEEVNVHSFGEGAKVVEGGFEVGKRPAVRLLYRPGHYDILYKTEGG